MVQFEHNGKIYTHDCCNTTYEVVRIDPTCGTHLGAGYITVPEMVAAAAEKNGWNSSYDRQHSEQFVVGSVKKFLSRRNVELN